MIRETVAWYRRTFQPKRSVNCEHCIEHVIGEPYYCSGYIKFTYLCTYCGRKSERYSS